MAERAGAFQSQYAHTRPAANLAPPTWPRPPHQGDKVAAECLDATATAWPARSPMSSTWSIRMSSSLGGGLSKITQLYERAAGTLEGLHLLRTRQDRHEAAPSEHGDSSGVEVRRGSGQFDLVDPSPSMTRLLLARPSCHPERSDP